MDAPIDFNGLLLEAQSASLGATAVAARGVSPPLIGTESAKDALDRVKYSHDAMIDAIIANPRISGTELAAQFGYSANWVSRVTNSDAFLARLAERKAHIVDPGLLLTVDEKLRAIASRSAEIVLTKLESPSATPELAFRGLEMATKAMGYGARAATPVTVNNSFVVALPQKATSETQWVQDHAPHAVGVEVVDVPAAPV